MPEALKTTVQTSCYHCGEQCGERGVEFDAHVFCCNGCKSVYELLNEHELCTYYSLDDKAGNRIGGATENDYAYLDEEKIKRTIINFEEGGVTGVTFYIPSIHCSSCIWLLENLHKIDPSIIQSTIQFQRKELDARFDSGISLRELARLLASLGYPPLITMDGKPVSRKSVNRSLYYKLGIAGFCFGNIMMLALPDYLAFTDTFSDNFRYLFSGLSLLLALPVFVFSASDYFTSSWYSLKNRTINMDLPIALGLIAAFGQSVYEIVSGTGSGYLDSLTGLVFFLLVGKWYQSKTYQALSFERDYKSYFPLAVTRVEEGKESFVPVSDLKPGDVILIRNGEIIPADAILVGGEGNIDYSFVTGESAPISKKNGDQLYAGGRQSGATIRLRLIKEVSHSYLTRLWNKEEARERGSGLTDFTNRVGVYFTIVVLLISLGSYLYWYSQGASSTALYAAVTVLIIFCPCIFSLAIPFCFGTAMNIMGRNGLYLKNAEVVERLASIDTVVFDKTGTITHAGEAAITREGDLTERDITLARSVCRHSTHPLSRTLSAYLPAGEHAPVSMFEEFPGQGMYAVAEDMEIRIGSASFVGAVPAERERNSAQTSVWFSIDGEVRGCFRFHNKYRPGLDLMLRRLEKSSELHLLSGDNDAEKGTLRPYFDNSHMHFNQSPADKKEYIKKLTETRQVLMVGDGLNDAGALLQSDCGISIVENKGSFSPACDAILEAASVHRLPDFTRYSGDCMRIVYWGLALALAYNAVGLYFAVQGILRPLIAAILMPVSSVSVIAFVVIMSRVLARRKYRFG